MNYYDCWTQIQWNLDITNLFLTKSSVWRTIFSPVLVKKRKRTSIWNLVYNTNKQILPAKRSELKSLNEVSLIKPWLLITANYVCKPIKIAINVTAQINRAERRERRNVVIKRGNSAVFAHFVKGIYAVRKKKCFDIHGWNCMELAAVLVESFWSWTSFVCPMQCEPARWATSNINFAFDVTAGKKFHQNWYFQHLF